MFYTGSVTINEEPLYQVYLLQHAGDFVKIIIIAKDHLKIESL